MLNACQTDEWRHFLKRADIKETELGKLVENSEEVNRQVCEWASYHAQTLTRTGKQMLEIFNDGYPITFCVSYI
jgi:ornithine carbamoyltransferase